MPELSTCKKTTRRVEHAAKVQTHLQNQLQPPRLLNPQVSRPLRLILLRQTFSRTPPVQLDERRPRQTPNDARTSNSRFRKTRPVPQLRGRNVMYPFNSSLSVVVAFLQGFDTVVSGEAHANEEFNQLQVQQTRPTNSVDYSSACPQAQTCKSK